MPQAGTLGVASRQRVDQRVVGSSTGTEEVRVNIGTGTHRKGGACNPHCLGQRAACIQLWEGFVCGDRRTASDRGQKGV